MSEPSDQRSATVIRQDIADYILKHGNELSDVSAVKEFTEQHGRLSKEIVSAKKRGKRLAKAKEKFEPFEKRVLDCRDALKNAEAELAKLYRPLGQVAFQAFINGSLKEQEVFSERLAVHKRIEELKQERDGLSPGPDAGMIQKTKAKAQQLAIAAKIKIEETKVGKQETVIGRKIVKDKLDESVRCDSTTELLGKIAEQREFLSVCSSELREADAAREKAANQLCEAVPLQHIESSRTFDAEMKACKKIVRESESSLAKATRSLIDSLVGIEQSKLPNSLTAKLDELKTAKDDASEHFKEAGEEFQEATEGIRSGAAGLAGSAKRWWGGLSKRGKTIVVVASCFVLLLAALSDTEQPKPNTSTDDRAAESESASGGETMEVPSRGNDTGAWTDRGLADERPITQADLDSMNIFEVKRRIGQPDKTHRHPKSQNVFVSVWKQPNGKYLVVSGIEAIDGSNRHMIALNKINMASSNVENLVRETMNMTFTGR